MNLFSSFDPSSWLNLPFNWICVTTLIMALPPLYWTAWAQTHIIMVNLMNSICSEFRSILNPSSAPGILLIPFSLLIFIMCNNSLGLLPYVFTASSHIMFTVSMAMPLWLGHMIYASIFTPNHVLAHLVPLGTPNTLLPFMVLIELISSIIRPLTLSVRLAANMIAGHLLLTLLASQSPNVTWSVLSVLFISLILLMILECAVSLIQAYVFSVLSTLYVNEVNNLEISKD